MSYGITSEGFIRKTLQEAIKPEIEQSWLDKFGANSDLTPDSINAILIGLFSQLSDNQWGALEGVYNSLNRKTATGQALSNAVALVGVTRMAETSSTAICSFRGTNSTILPINTQVKQSLNGFVFGTFTEITLTKNACNLAQFEIITLSNATTYRFYINSSTYSYISDADATNEEIIAGLKAVIEGASLGLTVTDDADGKMTIQSDDKNDIYDIDADSKMSVVSVQSVAQVQSITAGKIAVPALTIDEISTAIAGFDSVIQYFDGNEGRAQESDIDLRLRTDNNLAVAGFNFVDAIRARLLNEVLGVSYCRVYENDTLIENADGIPAKSYEVVIEGGSDTDVAEKLLTLKSAGLPSFGSTSVFVNDVLGVQQLVRFTRPTTAYFWVQVTINSYNVEETFPLLGEIAIQEAIYNYAINAFNIGDIVAVQKFYSPVYEIKGIADVTIKIATTATVLDAPAYDTININLSVREKPNFATSRIEIIL